jgi:AraC-like DNA-binding protein
MILRTEQREPVTGRLNIHPLISTALLRPLLLELERRAIDPTRVFADSGVSVHVARDPLLRITEADLRAIWQQAVRVTGEPALGVRVAQLFDPSSLGVVGHVLRNSTTLAEAVEHWQRFADLVDDTRLLTPLHEGRRLRLAVRRQDHIDPEANRPLVEFAVFSILKLLDFITGGTGRAYRHLHRLEFRHAPPNDDIATVYRQAVPGAVIAFAQRVNALIADIALLEEPVVYADPALLEISARRAEQALRDRHRGEGLVLRVRQAIGRRLQTRTLSVANVAADLTTSRATLQRRLQGAGVTFRQLVAETRREQALILLADPARPVAEIAYLLGYAEPAAFIHAFRRWTGRSPSTWRRMPHNTV